MKYLLDSNICIGILNGRSESLLGKLQRVPCHEIAVCSMVKAELFFGAGKSRNPEKNRKLQELFFNEITSLPFDDRAAGFYSGIRVPLEAIGGDFKSDN